MDEHLITRTYSRVWKLEHVIFRIERVPLPFPVSFQQIAAFFATLAILTPLYFLPWRGEWGVWLVLLPALTTWLVAAQDVQLDDGSLPDWGRLALIAGGAEVLWLTIKLILYVGHRLPFGWFVILPALLTWFLTRTSLDGRNPLKFVWVFLRYLLTPKRLSLYQQQSDSGQHYIVARVRVTGSRPGTGSADAPGG